MHRFRLLGFYVAGLVALIGLALAGVSLRRAATEASEPAAPPAGSAGPLAVKVSMESSTFEPKELVVAAGTVVTWVNADDVPHTVTSIAAPRVLNSRTLRAGDTFSFAFKEAGTYEYFCKVHPSMTGKVVVR
jgi:amicyanin